MVSVSIDRGSFSGMAIFEDGAEYEFSARRRMGFGFAVCNLIRDGRKVVNPTRGGLIEDAIIARYGRDAF